MRRWFTAKRSGIQSQRFPLNLWHLRSTFLIGSRFIPPNVSFLFLWALWRNRDYFADKMCVEENRSEMVLCTASTHDYARKLNGVFLRQVDAHEPARSTFASVTYVSRVRHFCQRMVNMLFNTSQLRMFLWWLGLDKGSVTALRKVVHLCCDTVRSTLQSGGIWYSALSPD